MNFEFGIPDDPHEECRHAIHELESELAQLREDRERYEWLKANNSQLNYWAVMKTGRHDIDAAVDQCRKAKQKTEESK